MFTDREKENGPGASNKEVLPLPPFPWAKLIEKVAARQIGPQKILKSSKGIVLFEDNYFSIDFVSWNNRSAIPTETYNLSKKKQRPSILRREAFLQLTKEAQYKVNQNSGSV